MNFGPFYLRKSDTKLFILPAFAVGMEQGMPFIEVAFLFWAIGVGDAG